MFLSKLCRNAIILPGFSKTEAFISLLVISSFSVLSFEASSSDMPISLASTKSSGHATSSSTATTSNPTKATIKPVSTHVTICLSLSI